MLTINSPAARTAGNDLEDDLRIAHQIAGLIVVMGHGHKLAAARPAADRLDSQPHEAGHFQVGRGFDARRR